MDAEPIIYPDDFDFKKLDPNFIYFIRYTKPTLGRWIFGPNSDEDAKQAKQTGIHTIIKKINIVEFEDSTTGHTAYYVRAEIVSEEEFLRYGL